MFSVVLFFQHLSLVRPRGLQMSQKDTAWLRHVTKSASADDETGSFTCHDLFFSLCCVTGQALNTLKRIRIPPVVLFWLTLACCLLSTWTRKHRLTTTIRKGEQVETIDPASALHVMLGSKFDSYFRLWLRRRRRNGGAFRTDQPLPDGQSGRWPACR